MMDDGRWTVDGGQALILVISLALACSLALLTTGASAQTLPPAGQDGTFDIATWNIEWFGDENNGTAFDEEQFAHVRTIIEQSQVDFWALQEISDPPDFYRLIDSLGNDFGGVLGEPGFFGGTQRLAFVYRREVVDLLTSRHLFDNQDEAHEFGYRPPLEGLLRITLPQDTTEIAVITLHAKCCDDQDEYDRREDGAQLIKNRIDFLRSDEPIIILGDFNDELEGSIRFGEDSPYEGFVEDTDGYLAATLGIEGNTYCSGPSCTSGSTIDHILLTDELAPNFVSSSRYTAVLDGINRYYYETSDHLPVYARLDFALSSAAEPLEALPDRLTVSAAVPNPFTISVTLHYRLPLPSHVRVDVYDVLGRLVETPTDEFRTAGSHEVTFAPDGLPSGVYFIRIEAAGAIAVQPVVHR